MDATTVVAEVRHITIMLSCDPNILEVSVMLRHIVADLVVTSFAFSVVLGGVAGCNAPCDPAFFEEHCAGNARIWCGEGVVVRDNCSEDLTCQEGHGAVACVDPSLTPCEPNVTPQTCSAAADFVMTCTLAGFYRFSHCFEYETCVSEAGAAVCVLSPLESCDPTGGELPLPLMRCSPDNRVIWVCDPQVGYMSEGLDCSKGKVCATDGKAAACVLSPLEPCPEGPCAADGRTIVDCAVGYVTSYTECPDKCYVHEGSPYGVPAACQP